jgi:hypothetical protein
MSTEEEQSFLAPFSRAINHFVQMTTREKLAFRREYSRFVELHERSLEQFATDELA